MWRWRHFTKKEVSCHCCGEFYDDPRSMDALEALRIAIGAPLIITSGHRCALHNAREGGSPLSMHKKLAFDIAIGSHVRWKLLKLAKQVGFTGIGLGQTFLHVDLRPKPATWDYGQFSRKAWQGMT